jgi:hypothetical protein
LAGRAQGLPFHVIAGEGRLSTTCDATCNKVLCGAVKLAMAKSEWLRHFSLHLAEHHIVQSTLFDSRLPSIARYGEAIRYIRKLFATWENQAANTAASEAGERQPPVHLQAQRRVLRHPFLQLQRNPGDVFAAND